MSARAERRRAEKLRAEKRRVADPRPRWLLIADRTRPRIEVAAAETVGGVMTFRTVEATGATRADALGELSRLVSQAGGDAAWETPLPGALTGAGSTALDATRVNGRKTFFAKTFALVESNDPRERAVAEFMLRGTWEALS